jgi:acyl carrier protein
MADHDIMTMVLELATRLTGNAKLTGADNFFDHGGDSLTAIELTVECEHRLGISIPIDTMFDSPTIAVFVVRVQHLAPPQ